MFEASHSGRVLSHFGGQKRFKDGFKEVCFPPKCGCHEQGCAETVPKNESKESDFFFFFWHRESIRLFKNIC